MPLSDITKDAVLKTISEFDDIGRQAFLKKYGYGPAREYFLFHNGRFFDSKAIIGVAHKYAPPENKPLASTSFSGGEATVKKRLEELEFEVYDGILDEERNPFLGGDHSWVTNQSRSQRGSKISRRLPTLFGKDKETIQSGHRNDVRFPAFVAVRWGFAALRDNVLVPTIKWEHREDYDDFGKHKDHRGRHDTTPSLEQTIRDDLAAYNTEEEEPFVEGEQRSRYITYYERNPKARTAAIRDHGVTCMACGFRFEDVYGARGKDYIEVHHIRPVSESPETCATDPREDMIVVCANCHRMIHRRQDRILTLEELKVILRRSSS